jgi:tellurite resistance protein
MNKIVAHFPVGFFGAVMGISTQSIAWQIAYNILGWPRIIGEFTGLLAIILLATGSIVYLLKLLLHIERVKAEFRDPETIYLFSCIPTSMILVAGLLVASSPALSLYLWTLGALLATLFFIFIAHRWIDIPDKTGPPEPGWLLPVAGFASLPFTGLSLPAHLIGPLSQLAFGGCLVMTLSLFALIFGVPLITGRKGTVNQVTYFFLIAPFTMCLLTYSRIVGGVDQFAGMLFYFSIFLLIVLSPRIFLIATTSPFRFSWWAVSFPLSLLAIAGFKFLAETDITLNDPRTLAEILLIISTAATALIFLLSLWPFLKGKLTGR